MSPPVGIVTVPRIVAKLLALARSVSQLQIAADAITYTPSFREWEELAFYISRLQYTVEDTAPDYEAMTFHGIKITKPPGL